VTKTVPLGDDRRAAIADAAIHLVATRGLRGLTHRAVDAEAGLPPGSTSYYLRTRDALLTACVHRMLDHDAAAVGEMPPDADPASLLVGMVVDLVRHRHDDLVARYELSLEAGRRPAIREVITTSGRQLRESLGELLAALGIADAQAAAWPVASMLDGLMYDRVAGAGVSLSDAEFEAGVRRSVKAVLSGLLHHPR
jgi:DNA-binding transcriptional regulator YbjK